MTILTGWLKLFSDGTKEEGWDHLVDANKASWSKGKLENIKEVRLANNVAMGILAIPKTNWHQFDRYKTIVSSGQSISHRLYRVIQAEINTEHVGKYFVCSSLPSFYYCSIENEEPKTDYFNKRLLISDLSKWITLVLPENNSPYIVFSEKGRINDNKYFFK